MSIQLKQQSNDFSCAPQLNVADMAEIAQLGFKTIVNHRPDGEGGDSQPKSVQLEAAAKEFGLAYYYFPVIPGQVRAEQVEAFRSIIAQAEKPILGFCRTGNRAANIFSLAQSEVKDSGQGVLAWLKSKCLITRLWRWYKTKCPVSACCKK